MFIQIGHSKESDFVDNLYIPIKNSKLFSENIIIFPHENKIVNSRETLKNIDIFVAEISLPTTGLGIELGFASLYGKRIIGIYKKGSKISNSIKYITDEFIEYGSKEEMIEKLEEMIIKNKYKE